MEIILNRHRKRKDTYDKLQKTVIFFVAQPKSIIDLKYIEYTNCYYIHSIDDRTFFIFKNVTTLKELIELCNILVYDDVFIIQDKIEEFVICEEYLNVNDIISKRYNVDTFKLLKSEIIELTQQETIFHDIKGSIIKVMNRTEVDVFRDISWTNYDKVYKFLL